MGGGAGAQAAHHEQRALVNPPFCCPSGYGTQAALWSQRLAAAGHDVAIAAFFGLHGAPLAWQGIKVYPGSIEHMWAQDLVPGHYRNHQADLLITLMDAWVLSPEMLTGQGMNVAHWMPVDCSPLSVLDRKVLAGGKGRPVAMSEFGRLAAGGCRAFAAACAARRRHGRLRAAA